MNDNYTKFKFAIQLLHISHGSTSDSMYTVGIYKIYSIKYLIIASDYYLPQENNNNRTHIYKPISHSICHLYLVEFLFF